jgi:hypothetical protein
MFVREERVDPAECNSYYHAYTRLVPDGDIVATLKVQQGGMRAALAGMSEAKAEACPASGEWSTKQVLCHLIDTERLFVFRAMWFARGETTDLPGMQPDPWVALAGAQARPLADLLDEFEHLRAVSVAFFANLDEAAWRRGGNASGFHFTVRALAWITAGHERHHLASLRDKYIRP